MKKYDTFDDVTNGIQHGTYIQFSDWCIQYRIAPIIMAYCPPKAYIWCLKIMDDLYQCMIPKRYGNVGVVVFTPDMNFEKIHKYFNICFVANFTQLYPLYLLKSSRYQLFLDIDIPNVCYCYFVVVVVVNVIIRQLLKDATTK